MEETTQKIIQILPDTHLVLFAARLRDWLIADLNQSDESMPDFTESRARALLRAADVVDDPTLHSFARLVDLETNPGAATAVRVALYNLLLESDLVEEDEISTLAATSAAAGEETIAAHSNPVNWLSLSIAAFAWKSGYPLYQLDPASPPGEYSPAGQLVKRAAFFTRQQVQRSATDRDKLGRRLAYAADAPGTAGNQTLETMPDQQPVAPLPPHYRPPIPVRYPEVARDTVQIDEDDELDAAPTAERGSPITIEAEELPGPPAAEPEPELPAEGVTRMPPIRITEEQLAPESRQESRSHSSDRSTVVTPRPSSSPASNFADNVRQIFGRGREPLKSTKLRIVVEEYPDGPGLYGLQIKVTCRGVKSFVAGTTDRDGKFLCELPVRLHSGLTYDVDVTWPRDMGGETERKSITLNADRTEFTLPFYRRISNED